LYRVTGSWFATDDDEIDVAQQAVLDVLRALAVRTGELGPPHRSVRIRGDQRLL
jgi:hypothetical protein